MIRSATRLAFKFGAGMLIINGRSNDCLYAVIMRIVRVVARFFVGGVFKKYVYDFTLRRMEDFRTRYFG